MWRRVWILPLYWRRKAFLVSLFDCKRCTVILWYTCMLKILSPYKSEWRRKNVLSIYQWWSSIIILHWQIHILFTATKQDCLASLSDSRSSGVNKSLKSPSVYMSFIWTEIFWEHLCHHFKVIYSHVPILSQIYWIKLRCYTANVSWTVFISVYIRMLTYVLCVMCVTLIIYFMLT